MSNSLDIPEIVMYDHDRLKDLGIDERSYNKFFYNDFLLYRGPFEREEYGHNGTDVNERYVHNSSGFRGPEFHEGTDVLFAGCSHTYGVGLAEGTYWAGLVAERLGVDHANVAQPGLSVYSVVSNIINYCIEYGNPKRIYCVFPELGRMQTFLDGKVLTSTYMNRVGFGEAIVSHIENSDDIPQFIKRPFHIEHTTTKQMCYFYSLKAIQYLEKFAASAGIELIWTVFHGQDHELMRYLKQNNDKYYQSFIDTKQGNWTRDAEQEDLFLSGEGSRTAQGPVYCHEELRSVYVDKFGIAGDIERGKQYAHSGVHRHIHIAEAFIDSIR